MDLVSLLTAQGDQGATHAVGGGVASGAAKFGLDHSARDEAQVPISFKDGLLGEKEPDKHRVFPSRCGLLLTYVISQ